MKQAIAIVKKIAQEYLKNPKAWPKKRILQTIAEELMVKTKTI